MRQSNERNTLRVASGVFASLLMAIPVGTVFAQSSLEQQLRAMIAPQQKQAQRVDDIPARFLGRWGTACSEESWDYTIEPLASDGSGGVIDVAGESWDIQSGMTDDGVSFEFEKIIYCYDSEDCEPTKTRTALRIQGNSLVVVSSLGTADEGRTVFQRCNVAPSAKTSVLRTIPERFQGQWYFDQGDRADAQACARNPVSISSDLLAYDGGREFKSGMDDGKVFRMDSEYCFRGWCDDKVNRNRLRLDGPVLAWKVEAGYGDDLGESRLRRCI